MRFLKQLITISVLAIPVCAQNGFVELEAPVIPGVAAVLPVILPVPVELAPAPEFPTSATKPADPGTAELKTASSALLARPLNVTVFSPERPGRTFYRWSVAAVIAGNAADTLSSWHHPEGNVLLASPGSNFDGRSLMIKSALIGGSFLIQRSALRHNSRLYKSFAWMNAAIAAGLGATAAHNVSLH